MLRSQSSFSKTLNHSLSSANQTGEIGSFEKQLSMIKEDFLHYVWRLKRFNFINLQTTQGEAVQLIYIGELNTHAGPDFTNARIKIGDTLWAGNVEIHVQSSEWIKHQHQEDMAYDNVILHVVLEEDQAIFRKNGNRIPCLELKGLIPPKLSKTYLKLLNNEQWIPCQHQFNSVSEITKNIWLDRLLVERLEQKLKPITQSLENNKYDWEASLYQMLARNFGMKVNADPFELLAKSLPLSILGKHKNILLQLEALLFGQAGMLAEAFEDQYPQKLQREYLFLQKKYQLQPILIESWKLLRMRPANFPTIRITQLAHLLFQSTHLFSKILAAKNVLELEHMFDVNVSSYWHTHYVFDKISPKRKKKLGKGTIHLLIINTIVPFLFAYGKRKAEDKYIDKALQLLEELPPEKNSQINKWKALGYEPQSAYQTQALLQLKKAYCSRHRCMECAIGNAIMQS